MIDVESPAVLRQAAADTGTKATDWSVEWYGRQTWPSTALGKEGAWGLDVMVPGHCIVVRQNGTTRRREYHTGRRGASWNGFDVVFIRELSARRKGHGVIDLTL